MGSEVSPTPHQPKPPVVCDSQQFSADPTPSRDMGIFVDGSCEPQSCSFSSLHTPQLLLPGSPLPPWGRTREPPFPETSGPIPASRPGEALPHMNGPPHLTMALFSKTFCSSSNSVFLLGIRLLEKKSQEILQAKPSLCSLKAMRHRGIEGNTQKGRRKKTLN